MLTVTPPLWFSISLSGLLLVTASDGLLDFDICDDGDDDGNMDGCLLLTLSSWLLVTSTDEDDGDDSGRKLSALSLLLCSIAIGSSGLCLTFDDDCDDDDAMMLFLYIK